VSPLNLDLLIASSYVLVRSETSLSFFPNRYNAHIMVMAWTVFID